MNPGNDHTYLRRCRWRKRIIFLASCAFLAVPSFVFAQPVVNATVDIIAPSSPQSNESPVPPVRKIPLRTMALPVMSPAPVPPDQMDWQNPAGMDMEEPAGDVEGLEDVDRMPRAPVAELTDELVIDLLELKNMDMADVIKLLSKKSGLNIIAGRNVQGKVSIYLKDVKLKDALRIILDANNLAYQYEDGIIHVMPAAEFETRYGYKFGGNIKTRSVRVEHTDVQDIIPILDQLKSPAGKVVSDAKSRTLILMDSAEKVAEMEKLIRDVDFPLDSRVYELTYAPIKDLAPKLDELLTKGVGSYRFDERSNRIVIKDTASKLREITDVIKAFDVRRRGVLIEAKIIQVVLNDTFKYGVDWEAVVQNYHTLGFNSNFDVLGASEKRGKVSIGILANDDYTAMVEALESVGKTNILSSPRISALNNEEAKIMVGSSEPYVTTTTMTPGSGPSTTSETVNFIDVGVKLYVTPTIHKDDFVTMKIRPEISTAANSLKTSTNNIIPIKESSEAETTIMVKNGATVVIGGLIKEQITDTLNKVPLLGDIPLAGLAFRNRSKVKTKTEIVIFLTPKIMTGEVMSGDEKLDYHEVSLRPRSQ